MIPLIVLFQEDEHRGEINVELTVHIEDSAKFIPVMHNPWTIWIQISEILLLQFCLYFNESRR